MPNWDVSLVTDMSDAFKSQSAFNADLSKWDVSSVTDMNEMFRSCTKFNADISKWDVSSVTDMSTMFYASYFNGDLSDWDVRRTLLLLPHIVTGCEFCDEYGKLVSFNNSFMSVTPTILLHISCADSNSRAAVVVFYSGLVDTPSATSAVTTLATGM